jgi:hypothetical protein
VVVQAKFREIAKTITTPGFSVFLAISRTPKKMSEPGEIIRVIFCLWENHCNSRFPARTHDIFFA